MTSAFDYAAGGGEFTDMQKKPRRNGSAAVS